KLQVRQLLNGDLAPKKRGDDPLRGLWISARPETLAAIGSTGPQMAFVEHASELTGDRGPGLDESDVGPRDPAEQRLEKDVVGRAQHDGVCASVQHRPHVVLEHAGHNGTIEVGSLE